MSYVFFFNPYRIIFVGMEQMYEHYYYILVHGKDMGTKDYALYFKELSKKTGISSTKLINDFIIFCQLLTYDKDK